MAMNYSERELNRLGDEDLARIISGVHDAFKERHPEMGDIAFPQTSSYKALQEAVAVPEQLVLRERFTPEERKVIEDAHGVIYLLTGLTLDAQQAARKAQNQPSFPYDLSWGGERLTAVPSRQIEVAIFPDPEEFFVPGSFNKELTDQERLAAEDAKRLSLPNVTQIIPAEASTLTEIVLQHEEITGKWLFGEGYAELHLLERVYGRTKNPTNRAGSDVACVGGSDPDDGVDVRRWSRDDGYHSLGAVRLVVPLGTK